MKKPVDLRSICEAYKDLSEEIFENYKKVLGFDMRNREVSQISSLADNLSSTGEPLNYFYIGYAIPQINKEFDLLRIGKDFILNIEVKSNFNFDKITSQLEKNQYYLESLGRSLQLFMFVYDENQIYTMNNGELVNTDFEYVLNLIQAQNVEHFDNIDNLFEPRKFLVSPFNDTDRFMKNRYFLTQQQNEFKRDLLSNNSLINIIEGRPGTGKSLLLYDIAKTLTEKFEVLIVHCGNLNEGHWKLSVEYGWNILPVKEWKCIKNYEPDIIFIDEAQRFRPDQLDSVLEHIIAKRIYAIFSLDPEQTLGLKEAGYNNKENILNVGFSEVNTFKLSNKIRTNKELHDFILGILDLEKLKRVKENKNFSVHYFSELKSAQTFAQEMKNEGWQTIEYTSQRYDSETIEKMKLYIGKNAHEVIGQEFDSVLAILGPAFYYDDSNKLNAKDRSYYDTVKMFYQAITRARKRIMLVIVDNGPLFSKIMNNFKLNGMP
ncbi:ATP-binding protein [Tetragenococcus koreensis]|uniref:ATP-binding protein n=1 Tax=Tetragenococcus koreensis TaxID=290335 RepID=UPI001F3E8AC0|nr:ATP-binding protein [Tetragenococcus koreensis]MCF1627475.1 ATP-binding protein [Tetragenococcus koreensis]